MIAMNRVHVAEGDGPWYGVPVVRVDFVPWQEPKTVTDVVTMIRGLGLRNVVLEYSPSPRRSVDHDLPDVICSLKQEWLDGDQWRQPLSVTVEVPAEFVYDEAVCRHADWVSVLAVAGASFDAAVEYAKAQHSALALKYRVYDSTGVPQGIDWLMRAVPIRQLFMPGPPRLLFLEPCGNDTGSVYSALMEWVRAGNPREIRPAIRVVPRGKDLDDHYRRHG